MRKLAALTLSLFLTSGIAFADSPKDSDAQPANSAAGKAKDSPKTDKSDSAIAAEIEELRQTLQSQQEQLTLLKEELRKRDHQIDEAREAAAAANSRATEASVKASEAVTTSSAARSASEAITNNAAANNAIVAQGAADSKDPKSKPTEDGPNSIRYKGVSLTPGGFIAAETVYRNHANSADINTPFTGLPFPGNSLSRVSEFNFTARQSRATLLAETTIGSAKVTGYYEGDFLGAGTTSNNRQSNSYVFRQRQLFAQVAFSSGLSITGGQMWSMATENKKGILNRQEALPMQIDPQYIVGSRDLTLTITASGRRPNSPLLTVLADGYEIGVRQLTRTWDTWTMTVPARRRDGLRLRWRCPTCIAPTLRTSRAARSSSRSSLDVDRLVVAAGPGARHCRSGRHAPWARPSASSVCRDWRLSSVCCSAPSFRRLSGIRAWQQ